MVVLVACVLCLGVSSGLAAGGGTAPAGTAAGTDAVHAHAADLLNKVDAAEKAAAPVVKTGKSIISKIASFPERLKAFRSKYGIPLENPTIDEEWIGVQRWLLEKGGVHPERAKELAAAMPKTAVVEHLKAPFRPESILMAVAATAGVNVASQLAHDGRLDLGEALGFLKSKKFWGGMIGSGIGYGVCAMVAASFFPPGAGIIAALVPTFAGIMGSQIGWEAGYGGMPEGLAPVLKRMDLVRLVGMSAGATVGIVVGGGLASVIGASLGSLAGPIGAILGGMLGGQLGSTLAGLFKRFLSGDEEALAEARRKVEKFAEGAKEISSELGLDQPPDAEADSEGGSAEGNGAPAAARGAASALDARVLSLMERRRVLYARFIEAMNRGDTDSAVALIVAMKQIDASLDEIRRAAFH